MSRLAATLGLLLAVALAAAPIARADESGGQEEKKGPPPLFSPLPKGDDVDADQLHFTPVEVGRRHILFAWGHIDSGDSERFRAAIDQAKPIEEVIFFSGGGDLEEGLQIGRIIRSEKLSTRIRQGMACISACNFMFMGGVVRSIDPGGIFGVHMFANEAAPRLIVADLLETKAAAEKAYRLAHAGEEQQGPGGAHPSLIPRRMPELTGGIRAPAEGSKPAAPATAPEVTVSEDDPYLRKLGCPEQAELKPKELEKDVGDAIKQVPDPLLRAEINPMLQRMTLHVLCMEQTDARQAAEIARFLVDMSLSLRFLTEFANIPNAHWRKLTRDELRDFNIVNTE
jgi:hypothetical protein